MLNRCWKGMIFVMFISQQTTAQTRHRHLVNDRATRDVWLALASFDVVLTYLISQSFLITLTRKSTCTFVKIDLHIIQSLIREKIVTEIYPVNYGVFFFIADVKPIEACGSWLRLCLVDEKNCPIRLTKDRTRKSSSIFSLSVHGLTQNESEVVDVDRGRRVATKTN